MRRKLRLKPKAKENIIFGLFIIAIVILGIAIANILSWRFHSVENDPRFQKTNYYEELQQKKTEMPGNKSVKNKMIFK